MDTSPKLLIVNPNTSASITETVRALVHAELGDRFALKTATAEFGFPYIASRAAIAVAGHAVLDAVARALRGGYRPDVILLACFGDPGLQGLAEICGTPVVGFAEAGLEAASACPGSFIAATRGEVWREVIGELAQTLGFADKLAGVETIDALGDDPEAIAAFLTRRAKELGAARILIGGAGLIPTLDAIAAASGVAVLDAHRAAIAKAVRSAGAPGARGQAVSAPAQVTGLSAHLEQLLVTGGPGLPAG